VAVGGCFLLLVLAAAWLEIFLAIWDGLGTQMRLIKDLQHCFKSEAGCLHQLDAQL